MPRRLSFAAVSVIHTVASGSAYGFEAIDATGLPSGTVYPALGRFERDGLVKSSWKTQPSPKGRSALRAVITSSRHTAGAS